MSVKIILDSTINIKTDLQGKFPVVPLTINFPSESFIDGVDITNDEFYKKLTESEVLPTTSQPTPDSFAQVFKEITGNGDQAVVITISSDLSGTFQSATIAAEDFEDKIFVVDSRSVSVGGGILAEKALTLVGEGKTAKEIKEILEREKADVRVFAILDTLEYLKKGGRISKTVAFAGGLMNFKPVIEIAGGKVESRTKGRGNKQGNMMLNAEIEKTGGADLSRPFLIGYGGETDELMQDYINDHKDMWGGDVSKIGTTQIGSVVGTHTGPGVVAVAYFVNK